MSNSTNNSTDPDDQCASGDRLCEVRVHQVELIVVPTLLMGMFLIVLLGLCILRFCSKKPAPAPSSPTDIHFENHHTDAHRHREGHQQHHEGHHQHHRSHNNQHHGDHHQHHGDHHQHHRPTHNHHPHHGGHHEHHGPSHDQHPQQSQPHRHSQGHRHSQPRRSTHRRDRQHLQGIDAPPELNPLEHEVLPLRHSTPAPAPAVPRPPTEWQHGTFQVVRPLPLSFSVKADDVVTLYRARLDRRDVILRVLKETEDARDRQAFQGFANFLSELGPHPFLPSLMGVVFSRTPLITAIEELENRDLLGFLWRCRQDHPAEGPACDITERHIFTMSGHIASALEYLHSKNCVHGNIGARSVLVGRDLTAKLWGLGPAYRRMSQPTTPGPLEDMELKKWQAPEALARRPASQNSDIWSFGILLYEMITLGDPPFPRILANELLQHLQRGSTLKRPAHCSNSLYAIIKACCQWSPQNRASLAEVQRKLQSGERSANATTVLRVPEPLDIEKYMREAGYGESYNYAVL